MRVDAEVGPFFTFFALKEAGPADDLDVAGYRGLRHFENRCEFANAEGVVEHEANDAPAGGIGEGAGESDDGIRHGIYRNE